MGYQEKQNKEKVEITKKNVLERLMSIDKVATVQICSDDKELGNIVEIPQWHTQHEVEIAFTPEPLMKVPEKEFIWNFVRNPSTNPEQIKERQDLLKSIKDSGKLKQFLNLKNGSYEINNGINGLFEDYYISDYNHKPALLAYRQGHEELKEKIMSCLRQISDGKEYLNKFKDELLGLDKPITKEVEENIKLDLNKIEHLNDEYFLKKDFDMFETLQLNDDLKKHLVYLGSVVEIANIAVKDGMCIPENNKDKPYESKEAWNFVRDKKTQTLNDSPSDKPLTVFNGSNMGGKSYKLMSDFYNKLLPQSYGCMAAKEGNFEVFDSFFYLDRASTQASHNLSAFGSEVKNWVNSIKKMGKKSYIVVDEGFSTTSAEDQYYLMMGVSEYVKNRGGKMVLSTHNEEFIKNHLVDSNVGIYNFPFTVEKDDEKGIKINYSHKMAEGMGDPGALDVAEAMGLPKEIIELAKNYLDGVIEKIDLPQTIEWKKIEEYTEEERELLKKEELKSLFNEDRRVRYGEKEKDTLFQLLSFDEEFGGKIYTGEKLCNDLRLGGWGYSTSYVRKEILFDLLTKSNRLNSKEVLERQKMFGELAHNDKFEEFRVIADKLVMVTQFLPKYYAPLNDGSFLDFNLAFSPGETRGRAQDSDFEYSINFLRLNKKVLGPDFPEEYEKLLNDFERGLDLLNTVEKFFENQDIFEINRLLQKDYDEVISNKKIVAKYLELCPDEPNGEKWEGKLTRRRLKEYVFWLKENNKEKFDKLNGYNEDPLKDLLDLVMRQYYCISLKNNNFDADKIKESFFKIADGLESKEAKEKWQDKICIQRISDLVKVLYKSRKVDYSGEINTLNDLLNNIHNVQQNINIEDSKIRELLTEKYTRVNHELINKHVEKLFESLGDVSQKLPKKSIFDCDLNSIIPEIKYFADLYKEINKNADLAYYNRWPSRLIFSLMLEMFTDKDYFKELPELLRSYDSVYLHQLANSFEEKSKNLLAVFKGKDRWAWRDDEPQPKMVDLVRKNITEARSLYSNNHEQINSLCSRNEMKLIKAELDNGSSERLANLVDKFSLSGPRGLFQVLETVYNDKTKEMLRDYNELRKYYDEIFHRYDIRISHDNVEYIREFLKYPEDMSREKMWKVVQNYEWFKPTRDGNLWVFGNAIDKEKNRNMEIQNFKNFYQNKIIDSGLKQKVEAFLAELDNAYVNKAQIFIDKYKVDFTDREGNSRKKENILRLKNGHLSYLKEETHSRFSSAVHRAIADNYSLDETVKDINTQVVGASALALFGQMINTEGYNPIKFNSTGEIKFKKMFNVFNAKDFQVPNDIYFDVNTIAILMAALNMAGKTWYGKSFDMTALDGMNTGYASAEEATMPLLDFVAYFDRVTEKFDKNLSALGNEVELWKKLLSNTNKDGKGAISVSSIDEAFSTTSPRYQAALVYAVVMYMIKNGQYTLLATHNHDVVNILRNIEKDYLKAYTIDTKIDEEGMVKFDHTVRELEPGERSFSGAIPVARTLGMPEEILQKAERIRDMTIKAQNGRVNLA